MNPVSVVFAEDAHRSAAYINGEQIGKCEFSPSKTTWIISHTGVEPGYTRFSHLSGKTVSMITGAPFEELVREKIPDVEGITFYSSVPDILLALKTGKTDATVSTNSVMQLAVNRDPALALFPQSLADSAVGFAFAKGDSRREDWQAALDAVPNDVKQALWRKWTGSDDSAMTLPEQDWPGLNGTVQVAACDAMQPMSYAGSDGKPIGFDIELLLYMARQLDVRLEFTGMEFSAVLTTVQSGKAQIGAGSIIITDERKQSVDFLEYYPTSFLMVVRTEQDVQNQGKEDTSFLGGIKSSFNKTFIREGRWRPFVDGVLTTLLITLLAILLGTLLGFAVFMLCRNGNSVANGVARFCLWLVQGMPMVVLLMILYYVVFGSVAVSSVAVAVLGFTLTFGAAAVYGFLKMGDIVRSRTYEAFFPLIAITVIYFVLEGLIGFIVSRISVNFNPKRRKPADILKGVKTDD